MSHEYFNQAFQFLKGLICLLILLKEIPLPVLYFQVSRSSRYIYGHMEVGSAFIHLTLVSELVFVFVFFPRKVFACCLEDVFIEQNDLFMRQLEARRVSACPHLTLLENFHKNFDQKIREILFKFPRLNTDMEFSTKM